MALISINLGLINLFPIPLLDGGHLLFFVIQAIVRKPLTESVVRYASSIGIVLISFLIISIVSVSFVIARISILAN